MRTAILVLDDDPSVAETLSAVLRLEGYSVDVATSGSEVLERLSVQPPDLVVADIRLDGSDGLAVVRAVHEIAPETPTVILTGYGSLESAIAAVREGAFAYMLKPCDVDDLKSTIARALERRRLSQQLRQRLGELEDAAQTIHALNGLLVEAADVLVGEAEPDAVLGRIFDLARRLLQADAYAIVRYDAASDAWPVMRTTGFDQLDMASVMRKLHEEEAGTTVFPRKPVVIEDAGRVAPLAGSDPVIGVTPTATLVVPLWTWNELVGAIVFSVRPPRAFTMLELRTASAFGRLTAAAVHAADIHVAEQEALHSREEFLAAASHDLRNPLSTIKASVQLLRRRQESGRLDREQAADALAQLDAIINRATEQVDEVLDVTRLQLGAPLELERQPIDLVALVGNAIADHQGATERHVISFEATVPDLVGHWDAPRLSRVLANLLGNAVKYSPAGGDVRVSLDRAEQADSLWAILVVRDQGVGIPATDLERIFGRFQRAANVGLIRGTGVGLASAREIVEQHGGTITVESEEGQGSTFIVRLPIF